MAKKSKSVKQKTTRNSKDSLSLPIVLDSDYVCMIPGSDQKKFLRVMITVYAPKQITATHLKNLGIHLKKFCVLASQKYIAGQLEHGGDFTQDVDHLKEAKKEVVDQWMYLNQLDENKELAWQKGNNE